MTTHGETLMKPHFLIASLLGGTLLAASAAQAAQGCGPGFHRGPWGYCRPNRVVVAPGPVVVGGPAVGVFYPGRGYWNGFAYVPALRVGVFYPGHGYWWHGRYWAHRYWGGWGWRYR